MEHKWDSSLETGYEPIDTQHKQLVEAVYALLDNCDGAHSGEQLRKSMDFLNSYTIKHFFDEEKIQQKFKYPDYQNHKKLHDDFKEVVKDLSHRLILEGPSQKLAEEVRRKIYDWLVGHIKIQDKKIGAHIKSLAGAV